MCSLAVGPAVSVEVHATPGAGTVTVAVRDYDTEFAVGAEPPEHRLLAEAVREAGPVEDRDVRVEVTSVIPPATSVGTSASVCVGVIAALDAVAGRDRPRDDLAAAAHRAEAGRLGRQSGVQDQVAAAHGGINLIDIDPYPRATARALDVDDAVWRALDDRLIHVGYGAPHDSSAVHDEVIRTLTGRGASSPALDVLRGLASRAATALAAGDLDDYGRVLVAATDAQAGLHPALLSREAADIVALARDHDAAGWKLNGAGGAGGSISVLCRRASDRPALVDQLRRAGHDPLGLLLARRGVQVVAGPTRP